MSANILGTPVPSGDSGSTAVVNLPSGIQAGETLGIILAKSNNAAHSSQNGWTLVDSIARSYHVQLCLFTRTADGTEGASVSLSNGNSNRWAAVAFRTDADSIGLYALDTSSGSASLDCPSITTLEDNRTILRAAAVKINNETSAAFVTPPTGLNLIGEAVSDETSNNVYAGLVSEVQATAGATGLESFVAGSAVEACQATIELVSSASAAIVDVDGDNEVTDGQTGVVVNLSGFSALPTFTLKYGGFETAALAATGDANTASLAFPDYANLVNPVTGVPVGKTVQLKAYYNPAEGDPETAEFDIVINPKTGYSTVDVSGAGTGAGYATDTAVADTSVALFADTINITAQLQYQIDAYPAELVIWHADTGIVEKFEVLEEVADTTKPVITLLGSATPTVELGGIWNDPLYTASDDTDGNITVSVVIGGATVDTNSVGDYVITYNVSDAAGNAADEVTRTVSVVDTTAPTVPANVQANSTGTTTATVTCDPATDLSGIAGYKVFLNGVYHDSTVTPSYDFTGLSQNTPYTVTLLAYDQYNNESAQSNSAAFTTAKAYAAYAAAVNMSESNAETYNQIDGDWESEDGTTKLPV
jgi:hypothetical protein